MEDIKIKHDTKAQEFTIELQGDTAELSYARPTETVIDFQHTYVPPSFQGRGVASKLIKHGMEYAEGQNLKVVASCQAVQSFLERNPEYKRLML